MFLEYINSNTFRTIKHLQNCLRLNNLSEIFEENGSLKEAYFLAFQKLREYHREHAKFLLTAPPIVEAGITDSQVQNAFDSCYNATQLVIDKNYECHSFHRKITSDILDYSIRGYGYNFLDSTRNHFDVKGEHLDDQTKYEDSKKADTHARAYMNLLEYSISKMVAIDLFLENSSMNFEKAALDSKRERFRHFFTTLVDAYNWTNEAKPTFNDKEKPGLVATLENVEFNLPSDSFKRVIESGIELDINKLQFQGRKTILCDLEKVSDEDLERAAKKMKFNGDLSSVNCYKILSGYKIKDARIFHNYWHLRKLDPQGKAELFEDISGNFVVVSKTPTSSFQAITTSIGRCLGSVNRKVTTAVMDSFDLGF